MLALHTPTTTTANKSALTVVGRSVGLSVGLAKLRAAKETPRITYIWTYTYIFGGIRI